MRHLEEFEKSLSATQLPRLEQKVGSVYIDVDVIYCFHLLGNPPLPHQRRRNTQSLFGNDGAGTITGASAVAAPQILLQLPRPDPSHRAKEREAKVLRPTATGVLAHVQRPHGGVRAGLDSKVLPQTEDPVPEHAPEFIADNRHYTGQL